MIEHIFEPRTLIKEINKVLKNEGLLIISSPNIRHWRAIAYLTFKGKFPRTSSEKSHKIQWDGGHIHYFTYKDIENLLRENGFEIITQSNIFKELFSVGIIIKARKI